MLGGSTVPGWSASITGPRMALLGGRSIRGPPPSPRASCPRRRRRRRPASSRTVVGGSTREAIRRPTYSSSVPASASGRIGRVRSERDDGPAGAEWTETARRPADRPSGICMNTAPASRTARADATCVSMPTAAAPDRSSPPIRRTSHSRHGASERGRPAPRDPGARLDGQRVHRHERVHPAPVRRGDEQVAPRAGCAPWPEVSMRNRKSTKHTNRTRTRTTRYSSEALASGVRPSQLEASESAAAGGGHRLGRDARRAEVVVGVGRSAAGRTRRGTGGVRQRSWEFGSVLVGHVVGRRTRHRAASSASLGRRSSISPSASLPPDTFAHDSSIGRVIQSAPSAPHVARCGMVGGRSPAGSRGGDQHASHTDGDERHRDDLRGGTPKNVQLCSRSVSSTKRVAPYQMKKTSNRSPGRSLRPQPIAQGTRGRPHRAAPRSTRTGTAGGSASSPRAGHCRIDDWRRWAQSIGMPHGSGGRRPVQLPG